MAEHGSAHTPYRSQASATATDMVMLLVEPDDGIADDLMLAASRRGVRVRRCTDGAEALVALGAHAPDLVVMAARIAVLSSSAVIQASRRHHKLCVLVGAGPGYEALAGEALAAGAAAIVARPYDIDSVLAIGRGLRGSQVSAPAPGHETLAAGGLIVDLRAYEARIDGVAVPLTARELDVLVYLIRRSGEVASRAEISEAVWGHAVDTNTVAVHIKRLRDKLGHRGVDPIIRTVRGAGYRLVTPAKRNDSERRRTAAV